VNNRQRATLSMGVIFVLSGLLVDSVWLVSPGVGFICLCIWDHVLGP
jgi:hypothetical protein